VTRLGEICSIVAATLCQISRSAIKKAGDFWPIPAGMRHRKSCPVIITGAGNGRAHTGRHVNGNSSAVPALAAKPTIDILLEVKAWRR